MHDCQLVAERIRARAAERGILLKDLLSDLNMSINTVSHISKGHSISIAGFHRIADYLSCSADYLLGRTDNPEINK